MTQLDTDDDLRALLSTARTIAVVGLSPRESRDSHRVARYMQEHGYTVIPVNPEVDEVLGEPAYANLDDVPHPVDIVNVFRRPKYTPEIAEAAVRIGARALWMQVGVINDEAARIASSGGLDVVMDRCLMVAHGRLIS